MSRTPLMRRRRIVAGALALAIPTAILATATTANAYAPTPGAAEIILEAGSLTGAGANALPSGWWGHEGSAHSQSTYFSLNTTGSTLAATLAKIGPDATASNLHTAFVVNPTTANVKPAITAGETVGQAYQWFDASGFGHSLAGNTQQNDYVDAVSTEASYNAWFNAGQPVYGFDNNLNAIDAAAPGAPLSGSHAIGKSILNNWPAGTQIGVVYYVSNANNANNEPIVLADSTGHAEAAYVPLTTVALPAAHSQDPAAGFPASYDTIRTSAGYVDTTVGDRTAATAVSSDVTSPQASGTSVTFSTTVTDLDNANAPVTAGSVTFYDGSTAIGTASTATTAGVWSLPVSSLAPGPHSITAVYNGPATGTHFAQSNAAAESFTISAANTTTVLTLNPDATNSTVTVHAGDSVTLTAHAFKTGDSTMTAVPGKVTFNGFFNGSTTPTVLGSNIATDTSGVATLNTTFNAAGSWTVQAVFTPNDTTNYQGSNFTTSSFTIAPSANPTATGNVTADIPAGTLTIQTPYTTAAPLNVGTLAPNADPTTGYTGSTTFGNIAITDTRAGDLPWTLTAQSSNLVGGTSGSAVINAENVGITNMTIAQQPTGGSVNFTNWFAAAAAGATAVGAAVEPSATGTLGLAGTPAKTLAHTAHGVGSWTFGGTLTVVAPVDTMAGHYAGTVTFTVLSQ
ncbi:MAG: beta strand repeat-containing protein [Marmoricola sp.]